MGFIIKRFFLLIILFLLQSCSGGIIGNFLESSFKNIEEPEIKKDLKNNLNTKDVIKSERNVEKNKNIEDLEIKEDLKNNLNTKVVFESEGIAEKNKNINETKMKEDMKKLLKNNTATNTEKKYKNKKKNY